MRWRVVYDVNGVDAVFKYASSERELMLAVEDMLHEDIVEFRVERCRSV